jgi:hypothetical protein
MATAHPRAKTVDRTAAQGAENGLARHPTPRVFIVDDHAMVRRGLRELFDFLPGWQFCRQAATGETCLRIERKPDVNYHRHFHACNGRFRGHPGDSRGAPQSEEYFAHDPQNRGTGSAWPASATGCVLKTDPEDRMLAALEAVMRGEVNVAPSFGPKAIARLRKKTPGTTRSRIVPEA